MDNDQPDPFLLWPNVRPEAKTKDEQLHELLSHCRSESDRLRDSPELALTVGVYEMVSDRLANILDGEK